MEDLILVLDAGTGGGRCVAIDKTGAVVARSYRAWNYFEPPDAEFYGQEFKPSEFIQVLSACCKEVIARIGTDAIKGVVTAAMRQGCVFLDEKGEPLYGGPNRDVRGIVYTDEVERALGRDRAYKVTGHWPPWMFLPARLRWFEEERPEVYKRIAKTLTIGDWLLHWLSGRAVAEPTSACETMLLSVIDRAWDEELVKAAGIEPSMLAEIRPSGSVAGEVSEKAEKDTGIPSGTPAIAGMADTQAALLAGGVIEPGEGGIVAGSTAPVMLVMDDPLIDPNERMWTDCHPAQNRWLVESNSGDAGLVYRGFVEGYLGAFSKDNVELYSKVDEMIRELEPGAMGARSFMGPVIWDLSRMSPQARAGVFFTYPPGEQNAGPKNVARAILENIAFALKANLKQAESLAGAPKRMVMAGGLTRTSAFNEIVAAVLGRGIEVVVESEATAVGAGMAGFAGIGVYDDLKDAAEAMKGKADTVEPDEDMADDYEDLYDEWREEYDIMMVLDED